MVEQETAQSVLMNPYQTASNSSTQVSPNTSAALVANSALPTPYNDPATAALATNPAAYNLAMEHPQLYGFAGSADINPYYWPNGLPNSIPNPYPAALPAMQR